MLNRDDIDVLWNGKDQFPKDFRAEVSVFPPLYLIMYSTLHFCFVESFFCFLSMKVLFSEVDSTSPLVTLDVPGIEEKGGLPIEAFATVQEIFSYVDWSDPKRDVALNMLQKITSSNILQETLENVSLQNNKKEKLKSILLKGSNVEKFKRFSPQIAGKDNLLHEHIHGKDTDSHRLKPVVPEDHITSSPSLSLGEQPMPSLKSSKELNLTSKKFESQELQQHPQPTVLSQRFGQTSLSNSPQASPVSISRYHSAPSVLGITALLQDHAVPKAKEAFHQVTTSLGYSISSPELAQLSESRQPSTNSNIQLPPLFPMEAMTVTGNAITLPRPPPRSSPSVTNWSSVPAPATSPHASSGVYSFSVLPSSSSPLPVESTSGMKSSVAPPLPRTHSNLEPLHSLVTQNPATSPRARNQLSSVPPAPPPPPSFSEKSSPSFKNSYSSMAVALAPSRSLVAASSSAPGNPMPPPPPPPPLPTSSRVVSSPNMKDSSSTPPPLPPSPSTGSSDTSPLHVKHSVTVIAPPPPPPPPLRTEPAANITTVPPPPTPPSLASNTPVTKTSQHAPPVPLPPAPSANGLSKAGAISAHPQSAASTGNIPSIPGPPFSAKGRLNLRTSTKNQGQPKKTSLKPYHWLKLTRVMQGSLWAEAQKSDEASKYGPYLSVSSFPVFLLASLLG